MIQILFLLIAQMSLFDDAENLLRLNDKNFNKPLGKSETVAVFIDISWDMPKPCIVGKGFKDLCIFRKGSLLTISQIHCEPVFSDGPKVSVLFSSS